jgi:hypothetical protein
MEVSCVEGSSQSRCYEDNDADGEIFQKTLSQGLSFSDKHRDRHLGGTGPDQRVDVAFSSRPSSLAVRNARN